MTSKNFVWLAQGGEGYGVLNAIFTLSDQCRLHGHSVSILTMREGLIADYARSHGYSVAVLEDDDAIAVTRENRVNSVFKSIRKMVDYVGLISNWLKDGKTDYLYIVPNIMAVPGSVAAKKAGVQAIWEMSNAVGDDYIFSLNKRFYQLALCYSNTIVLANSAYSGTTVAGWGVKPLTFHLGVDEDKFKQDRNDIVSREMLGISEHTTVFALYARMTESKGQAKIVEAIGRVKDEYPDICLCLAGGPMDSEYVCRLKERIKELEIEDKVLFLGQLSDVERYYGLVDVSLNLRIDPEPFGLSVIESMLMGKPVLVHASGGPAETVLDGQTGWHIHSMEVEVIAEKLREILTSVDSLSEMGQRARAHALENFTSKIQYAKLESLLGI